MRPDLGRRTLARVIEHAHDKRGCACLPCRTRSRHSPRRNLHPPDPTHIPAQRRPRCLPTVAPVQALLQRARAAGMPVAYSLTNDSVAGDILPELAPIGGEPIVKRGVDKFLDTDLDAQLKSRGIKTVIIVGVAAQGAVMATMIESVLHGYDVVLAVDGVSGDPYAEQYVAWHLMNGPNLAGHGSLTTTDMIHF